MGPRVAKLRPNRPETPAWTRSTERAEVDRSGRERAQPPSDRGQWGRPVTRASVLNPAAPRRRGEMIFPKGSKSPRAAPPMPPTQRGTPDDQLFGGPFSAKTAPGIRSKNRSIFGPHFGPKLAPKWPPKWAPDGPRGDRNGSRNGSRFRTPF